MSYITTTITYEDIDFEVEFNHQDEQKQTLEQEGIPGGFEGIESITLDGLDFTFLYELDPEGIEELLYPQEY